MISSGEGETRSQDGLGGEQGKPEAPERSGQGCGGAAWEVGRRGKGADPGTISEGRPQNEGVDSIPTSEEILDGFLCFYTKKKSL